MPKYLLLYRAPVSAAEQMAANDPAAAQAGMDACDDGHEKLPIGGHESAH